MGTVNSSVRFGEGVREFGRSDFSQWGKTSAQTFYNLFLKRPTEGGVTTEAGSLFQYFTTLTEKADPLLRQWLIPCRGAATSGKGVKTSPVPEWL